jgi:hypothetical protein
MSFVFRPAARFLLSCFCLTALLNAMGAISPQRKLNQGGPDPERIPFGEELTLQTLVPGAYIFGSRLLTALREPASRKRSVLWFCRSVCLTCP